MVVALVVLYRANISYFCKGIFLSKIFIHIETFQAVGEVSLSLALRAVVLRVLYRLPRHGTIVFKVINPKDNEILTDLCLRLGFYAALS